MSEDVKPRRGYDSRRRQAQAAHTRQDILAAARDLFLAHGYAGTTLAAVARAAGVVVETIYRGFGGKAGLFKAVIEASVAGSAERARLAPEQRPAIQAVIEEVDPYRQLERYAATQPGIHARMGPLLRALTGAAATDSQLADVMREMEEFRLAGMERFAQLLADRGALRPGVSVDHARDVLWTINSHAVYDQLVLQRGWPPEQYQRWLTHTLIHALLPFPPADGPRSSANHSR